MCFSDRLTESAAYFEGNGHVLVGYKTVVNMGGVLMPMNAAHSLAKVAIHCNGKRASSILSDMALCMSNIEHPVFNPRELLVVGRKKHPFHVAASEREAITNKSANYLGYSEGRCVRKDFGAPAASSYDPSKPTNVIDMEYEDGLFPVSPVVAVRVLVPANAVDKTNHVHAMVVIPPGERETDREIALCDEWNRRFTVASKAKEQRPEDVVFAPKNFVVSLTKEDGWRPGDSWIETRHDEAAPSKPKVVGEKTTGIYIDEVV